MNKTCTSPYKCISALSQAELMELKESRDTILLLNKIKLNFHRLLDGEKLNFVYELYVLARAYSLHFNLNI